MKSIGAEEGEKSYMNAIVEIAAKQDIIVTKLQSKVETESVNLNWYKIARKTVNGVRWYEKVVWEIR